MNIRRLVSIFLAFAIALVCAALPAAAAEPWDGMDERVILENISSAGSGVGEDGYFLTLDKEAQLSSAYAKIDYTISGTYTDDTKVFILKPFDTEWQGWDETTVTISSSVKQAEGEYTAYVSLSEVKASLSSGGILSGINSYLVTDNDCAVTVKTYSLLSPKADLPPLTKDSYYVTDKLVRAENVGAGATLIVALYRNGEMLDSRRYKGDDTITADYAADMAEALKTATDIKAFVWDGMERIIPKGDFYESSIEALSSKDKQNLKLSLDYCANMDPSKYQAESWQAFQKAVDTAQTAYETSTTDAQYLKARQTLESAKSKLLFINTTDPGTPLPFRELSNSAVVHEMGAGWNLGNTMDGHAGLNPSETSWQSVITTKEIIKSLHDAGFNTIRVPVTWGNMIDFDNNAAINDAWINRVQDIVDYCTELDMYTIINIHHDGAEQTGWLRVAADDIDSVYEKFEKAWRTIAYKFRDYDEHLIFESANELTCMEGDNKNSSAAKTYDIPVIMNLNQIFVNTVRATGSNNTKRWLGCVSHYANAGTDSAFKMPSDSYNASPRLMFGAHIYKSTTKVEWTYEQVYEVVSQLKGMHNKFKAYPMYLGEYGNRNYVKSGTKTGFNDVQRAWYDEIVNRACQVAGVVPCPWDQGWFDASQTTGKGDASWTIWDREGLKPRYKTITDALMRGTYLPATTSNKSYNMKDIVSDPDIIPITSIVPSETSVSGTIGDSKALSVVSEPQDSNDVVLWKSDNDDVATVSRGLIRFNKIGTAEITAYSQSGSAEAKISVTVMPETAARPIAAISTEGEVYNVAKGKYTYINAAAEPADTDAYLTYNSVDPHIASVNRFGKIVGISAGETYIVITASSGMTKTVKVTVTEAAAEDKLHLAVNVYYNDPKYNANETGQPITVTGDGQYTLTFDTASDLSADAAKAGIAYLKNLTSIYIKDDDVTDGIASKSPIDSCEIQYDSIKVDGKELTITKPGFKNAVKDNGVLDTNDPINSWDGSAVAEVAAIDHVANFKDLDNENPQKIEIVFTLRNLVFTHDAPADIIPAISLNPDGNTEVKMLNGTTGQLTVNVSPSGSNSRITFISSDKSVALTQDNAVTAQNGKASAQLTAVKPGTAKIKVIADSGAQTEFTVTVE